MGTFSPQQGGTTDVLKFINDFIANINKAQDNAHQKETVRTLRRLERHIKEQNGVHKRNMFISNAISIAGTAGFGFLIAIFA